MRNRRIMGLGIALCIVAMAAGMGCKRGMKWAGNVDFDGDGRIDAWGATSGAPYDPTNGTVSMGDVVRSNKGVSDSPSSPLARKAAPVGGGGGMPLEIPPLSDRQSQGFATFDAEGPASVTIAGIALGPVRATGDTSPAPAAPKPVDRKIIYNGNFLLRVPNRRVAAEAVGRIAGKHGGFVQRSSLEQVIIRVSPEKFDKAVAEIEALGEVASREISREDVTENYTDVILRLQVAEASMARLKEILRGAKETKDVLEIERDIRRLTEEIERYKGQLRVLDNRIDLATITVNLQEKAAVESRIRRGPTPFNWIASIGADKALESVSSKASLDGGGGVGETIGSLMKLDAPGPAFHIATPEGFLKVRWDGKTFIAATSEDWRLRAQFVETPQKGDLAFWATALKTDLADARGYKVNAVEDFAMKGGGLQAKALHCEASSAGLTWAYDVWLIQPGGKGKELLAVEYVRPQAQASSRLAEVETAVKGAGM